MRQDDPQHTEDHVWLRSFRQGLETSAAQWSRVKWAVITALSVGAALSLSSLMFWAFSIFVQRGGQ